MYGGLVAIFWNFIALLLPWLNRDFYSSFAHLPYANYDANFYDGIANDSNQTTTMHSLSVRFLTVNSIFDNLPVILTILICLAGDLNSRFIHFFLNTTVNNFYFSCTNNILDSCYHLVLQSKTCGKQFRENGRWSYKDIINLEFYFNFSLVNTASSSCSTY